MATGSNQESGKILEPLAGIPLKGGYVEVFSDQPWDVISLDPEDIAGLVKTMHTYGPLPHMSSLPEDFTERLGTLGRPFTDEERARLAL
ncbi:MAG: hypothetical protein JWO47_530 [Candidatus Saccharibacteria bacterium]|nr:hypothetical protein [Candidatus Saccharibacteria bacterium]